MVVVAAVVVSLCCRRRRRRRRRFVVFFVVIVVVVGVIAGVVVAVPLQVHRVPKEQWKLGAEDVSEKRIAAGTRVEARFGGGTIWCVHAR